MLDAQRPLRGIRQKLNQLRMPELRNVLTDLNLQRAGRKAELVDRIAATLEAMDRKAADTGAGNAAMAAFYRDQLKNAIRSVERQMAPPPRADDALPLGAAYSSPPASRYAAGLPPGLGPAQPSLQPVRRDIPSFQASSNRYPGQHQGYHAQARAPMQYAAGPAQPGVTGIVSTSGGADLYSPRNVSELAGARCFCGVSGVSGKLIACVKCGLQVHAKCHQLITLSGEWYCETCRAQTYDPFYTVKRTVLAPTFVRFVRSSSVMRLEYVLQDDDLSQLYAGRDPKPGAMTPGSLELQLRCFALKDELSRGHCWPTTTQLYVNSFGVPLTQRAPPGSANPSKVLRELPANIFQYSRAGRNVVELRTADNPALFAFEIQIVEIRNVDTMVAEIKEASQSITYESAKKQVIASFGGGDDDDDDDGIEATCTMLSIRCPLGLCVIDLPARGRYCKHLQCFDLKTFLLFNRKARSKAWRCTVCHNFIKASDLRIDPYLKRLLNDVAGEEELEEVEIFPDGSWKRRVGDDIPAPAPKRVKTEQGEGATSSGTNVNPEAAALDVTGNTTAGSSSAPVEIDLLSSDDDDDDDDTPLRSTQDSAATSVAASTPAAQTAAPAPAVSTTTQPILLDDDLGILTVGSDAWETPTSNSASGGATDDTFFNFPLEDALFGGSTTSSTASSTTSSWNTSTATTTTISPPEELLNESEMSLANAMADLSRNHPNVSNPFERRRPTPSVMLPSTAQPASSRPPQPDPLDIIYLLDSDSD